MLDIGTNLSSTVSPRHDSGLSSDMLRIGANLAPPWSIAQNLHAGFDLSCVVPIAAWGVVNHLLGVKNSDDLRQAPYPIPTSL
jgi:hypothetical protein